MEFDRITFDSQILGGRACIRGMRIPVSVIVGQIVGNGFDVDLLCGRQVLDPLGHQAGWYVEDAGTPMDQLALRGVDVAIVSHLA